MESRLHDPGTFYTCGCWWGGNPEEHPEMCPTHNKPWKIKWSLPWDDFSWYYQIERQQDDTPTVKEYLRGHEKHSTR